MICLSLKTSIPGIYIICFHRIKRERGQCLIMTLSCYAPPLIGGGIKRCFCLTSVWRLSVCLSRTSDLSREQRGLGRPKLAQSYVTRTPLSSSKSQRSRSPGRFAHRRVGASGGCSGGRENVLAVGNCCYVAVCLAAEGASAPTGEERGGAYRGGRLPTACLKSLLLSALYTNLSLTTHN